MRAFAAGLIALILVSCRTESGTPQSGRVHAPSPAPYALLSSWPLTIEEALKKGFKITQEFGPYSPDEPGIVRLAPTADTLRAQHCQICEQGPCVRVGPNNTFNGWRHMKYWDCEGPGPINHRPKPELERDVIEKFEKKYNMTFKSPQVFLWRGDPSKPFVGCICLEGAMWDPEHCKPGGV